MQLLKDMDRITRRPVVEELAKNNWKGTWANRILDLDAGKAKIASYNQDNPGKFCIMIKIYR